MLDAMRVAATGDAGSFETFDQLLQVAGVGCRDLKRAFAETRRSLYVQSMRIQHRNPAAGTGRR